MISLFIGRKNLTHLVIKGETCVKEEKNHQLRNQNVRFCMKAKDLRFSPNNLRIKFLSQMKQKD